MGVAGLGIDIVGLGKLGDAATVEHDDAVTHGQRLGFAAGHMQKSYAELFADAAQFIAHAAAQIGVERAQRFVEQHEARRHHQRAGERHALLLATGNLMHTAAFHAGEADEIDDLPYAPVDVAARHRCFAIDQAEGDIVEDREMRKQREILEDEADAALMGRHIGDVAAIEDTRGRDRELRNRR